MVHGFPKMFFLWGSVFIIVASFLVILSLWLFFVVLLPLANGRKSIRKIWDSFSKYPGGAWVFSKIICIASPYTGSVKPMVVSITKGEAVLTIRERRALR